MHTLIADGPNAPWAGTLEERLHFVFKSMPPHRAPLPPHKTRPHDGIVAIFVKPFHGAYDMQCMLTADGKSPWYPHKSGIHGYKILLRDLFEERFGPFNGDALGALVAVYDAVADTLDLRYYEGEAAKHWKLDDVFLVDSLIEEARLA